MSFSDKFAIAQQSSHEREKLSIKIVIY